MPKASDVAMEPSIWVTEMQHHFQANGYYRASDLYRVLGDPRENVGGDAGEMLAAHMQNKASFAY